MPESTWNTTFTSTYRARQRDQLALPLLDHSTNRPHPGVRVVDHHGSRLKIDRPLGVRGGGWTRRAFCTAGGRAIAPAGEVVGLSTNVARCEAASPVRMSCSTFPASPSVGQAPARAPQPTPAWESAARSEQEVDVTLRCMTAPLHLALGDSAAGCLREACAPMACPEPSWTSRTDYSHGPLMTGRHGSGTGGRATRSDDDWPLKNRRLRPVVGLAHCRSRAVATPGTERADASEAASWPWPAGGCATRSTEPLSISLPGSEGRCHVAAHAPEELTALYERGRRSRSPSAPDWPETSNASGTPRVRRRWRRGTSRGASRRSTTCSSTADGDPVTGHTRGRHGDGTKPQLPLGNDLFLCSRLQVPILPAASSRTHRSIGFRNTPCGLPGGSHRGPTPLGSPATAAPA